MNKYIRRVSLALACLVLLTGCSLQLSTGGEKQEPVQQEQQEVQQNAPERPDPGPVEVAGPVEGQRENPVLTPEDHGRCVAGMEEVLTTLLESMRVKDLSRAEACFHGLDETGITISTEELQRQVETLHPVDWRVENYRAVGKDGALVEVSYTMPGGKVYRAQPFTMLSAGDTWTIHLKSFGDSFQTMAAHLLKREGEPRPEQAVLWEQEQE